MASFKKLKSGWQYRISYKANGKYSTKSENGFRTKGEAKIAASEMEQRLNKGYDIRAAERFFPEYFRDWYDLYRKGKKGPDNDGDIRRAVEFAEEKFVGVKLKDLTRNMYQQALNDYGETHATASVKKHHTYMRACLRDAIQDEVIFKDPTYKAVAVGKVAPKNEDLKYLSYGESKRLILELMSNLQPRYISRYIILFGLATGCRFSEIIGMTWDCVDFVNHKIKINKTWDSKYTNNFSNTKNYSSKRTITIDEETLNILDDLKKQQNKNAVATGLRNTKNLVFANSKMELVSNSAVNKTLRNLCQKVNVTKITCHSLRHTHASMLLYKRVNVKYLSRRLGHKDIVTTLQTYSHIIDEMEQMESRQVDNTMEELYNAK
ncbi:tyrosine-type recombinase/integrase [Tuberibacillus sp. Marseille-P3662]|uniref:tyrosine-type recombinase/integrase n=1 Tax=Tuberibacillus sp. Marseille-P3662 TaxID=1965358 RepID=UPI000A1C85BB|nr:tyrosine-type recombinase/integrase [Tuberibacillus sp. Marseille-P3662]